MPSGFVLITEEDADPGNWIMVRSRAGGVYANHHKKAVQVCLNGGIDSVAPGVYPAQFGICSERYMGTCARVSVWPDNKRKESNGAGAKKLADILGESLDIPESGVLARDQGPSFVYLYIALDNRLLGVTWTIYRDNEKVYHISCISRTGSRSRRIERSLPDRDSLHDFVNGDGAAGMAQLCREMAAAGHERVASVA